MTTDCNEFIILHIPTACLPLSLCKILSFSTCLFIETMNQQHSTYPAFRNKKFSVNILCLSIFICLVVVVFFCLGKILLFRQYCITDTPRHTHTKDINSLQAKVNQMKITAEKLFTINFYFL